MLHRQRSRWHRGLWETLWAYRGMLFRRRYGRVGWVGLPYYWLFELRRRSSRRPAWSSCPWEYCSAS